MAMGEIIMFVFLTECVRSMYDARAPLCLDWTIDERMGKLWTRTHDVYFFQFQLIGNRPRPLAACSHRIERKERILKE